MKTFLLVLFIVLISCKQQPLQRALAVGDLSLDSAAAGKYSVNTGAGLIFQVNRKTGDLVSINFGGYELQDKSKFSQIGSGLGSSTSVSVMNAGDYVSIACQTPTLMHYYMARKGVNAIFMATYTTAEPSIGELRYIARLNKSALPNANSASSLDGTNGTVEGSDVFRLPSGETRSKFYGAQRAIDEVYHAATGDGVGAFMFLGNRETSSGGPFFRDIGNQGGTQQEIYNYMNSGHAQTEPYRIGLHGPYALVFTDGSVPSVPDYKWIEQLDLAGFVKESDRGEITGSVDGSVPSGVIGWRNDQAQYWTPIVLAAYRSPKMIPGSYEMTLYDNELAVSTSQVTVSAGETSVVDLSYPQTERKSLFRIGNFDGTPAGFLNDSLQLIMHPSDVRMSNWGPTTFTVGSDVSSFPMAQFKSVNSPTTIIFSLTADQIKARTLYVGITLAFAGGRPQIVLNSGTASAYSSPVPAPSQQPNSRGVTRGTYRGNNTTYAFNLPSRAFVEGDNKLEIYVSSGSSGDSFLSPNFVYDAVELSD